MSPVEQLLKNFSIFYGTRGFITVFTRALHWFLSYARSTQFISPHPIFLILNLLLFSHQRLDFPVVSFLQASLRIPLSPIRATRPAHLILLDLIILIILDEDTSYEAPHYAIFSDLLLQNI
jgi:hypothetical protein